MNRTILPLILAACALQARGEDVLFHDSFSGRVNDGWSWLRENKSGWRIGAGALEIRVEPGNMWGPANDAKNVLVRDLPVVRPLVISVTVSNNPTEQYEQVDLVWYCDDSHMVKIGFELVDGKRSIVMGREEKDRTRTIAIIPIDGLTVDLRLVVDDMNIQGAYRKAGSQEWLEAGSCELPSRGVPKMSIQCYQGPSNVEHWARIFNATVRAPER